MLAAGRKTDPRPHAGTRPRPPGPGRPPWLDHPGPLLGRPGRRQASVFKDAGCTPAQGDAGGGGPLLTVDDLLLHFVELADHLLEDLLVGAEPPSEGTDSRGEVALIDPYLYILCSL